MLKSRFLSIAVSLKIRTFAGKFKYQKRWNINHLSQMWAAKAPTANLNLFIIVNGFDELYNRLKESPTFIKPLHTMPRGREFAICDNNGYIVVFAKV